MEKEDPNKKHKKKPSQPKADGLKPKGIKWKKKHQMKTQIKTIIA